MAKTTKTTERYEVCGLCGGRGQEYVYNRGETTTTSTQTTCRGCNGSGQRLAERTVTTEETPDWFPKY